MLIRILVLASILCLTAQAALLSSGFLADPAGDQAFLEYGGDLLSLSVNVDSVTGVEFWVHYDPSTFLLGTATFIWLDTHLNPATGTPGTGLDSNLIGIDHALRIQPRLAGSFADLSPFINPPKQYPVEYRPGGVKLIVPLADIGGNPFFNFKVTSMLAPGGSGGNTHGQPAHLEFAELDKHNWSMAR